MSDTAELPRRRLLTTDEAAAYIGTKSDTMYRWRRVGRGPKYVACAGFVRYDLAVLDAWLDAGGDIAAA